MMMKVEGFDEAIIGLGCRCGAPNILVYDSSKCIDILVRDHGMNTVDALEYFEYNILGAYVGESTPVFVYPDYIEALEDDSD